MMLFRNVPRRGFRNFLRDEGGAGVVEMIMIIAVVIIVAIIFRDQLIAFVKSLLNRAESTSNDMFDYKKS